MIGRVVNKGLLGARELNGMPGAAASGFRILSPEVYDNDVVIEGDFRRMALRSGLTLHVSNVIEHFGITTQSVQPALLSLIFFLQGRVDLTLGNRVFHIGNDADHPAEGLIIARTQPELFTRRSLPEQRVCKVVINMAPEWLEGCNLDILGDWKGIERFANEHLSSMRWRLSPVLVALLDQIIHPPPYTRALQQLYLESKVIEVVFESLRNLTDASAVPSSSILGPRENMLMRRAQEYIEAHLESSMLVETIARDVGASPSVLQRLFRSEYNTSLFSYVRHRKLQRACEALQKGEMSIAQAAEFAGYSNPANFNTAFKNLFGFTPGAARRRN